MSGRVLPTVSITVVRGLFAEAMAGGLDPALLCSRFRVTPEQLGDSDARVGLDVIRRMWDELPDLLGDANFGLHAARRAHESGALGIVGYVLRAAPTVGEGLRNALRFQRLLTDGVRARSFEERDHVRFVFEDLDAAFRPPRQAAEFALATLLNLVASTTGRPLHLLRVEFRHARPTDDAEARRTFECTIRYGAPVNAIAVRKDDLDRPQGSADPHLFAFLERHARQLHERLPERSVFAARVRRALAESLATGEAGLDELAKSLGMSRRTLQRRLREEQTTLQRVLDDLRRDLAKSYLADASLDLQSIAFLLGFSSQSAFHHAFVRWTGVRPGAFRRELAG